MKEITLKSGSVLNLSDEDFAVIKAQFVSEPVGRWKPKLSQDYFYVDARGIITYYEWDNDEYDQWIYAQGNCFKTEEEAAAHNKYLEAAATIRNSSSFVPDWGNSGQYKYSVCYGHNTKSLAVTNNIRVRQPFTTYYESQEAAEQAAKTYKKEYLLVMGIK